MRERLKELGGTFELLSGPNLGSSVVATIPLNRTNLAEAVS
jgi:signal transduction histidine kinase